MDNGKLLAEINGPKNTKPLGNADEVAVIRVVGGNGDNQIDLTALTKDNSPNLVGTIVDGGNGDDTIRGTFATDVIIGDRGSDQLAGEGGDDVLDGVSQSFVELAAGKTWLLPNSDVSGSDTIDGGDGIDHAIADSHDTVIDVEQQSDTL